ncbi:MAG: HEAT repeat domain-containing protein [Pirellulaceae bacterium]
MLQILTAGAPDFKTLSRLARPSRIAGLVCSLIGTALVAGCTSDPKQPFSLTEATYVGQESCVKCHAEEAQIYAGSHHDQAMQVASADTVLGDFTDAEIEHHGIVSKMFRRDGKYFAHTEGPDGRMQDFEVKYVFGLEPLQQYMIEFPSEDTEFESPEVAEAGPAAGVPRVQVLRICWNTSKNEWFYLAPPDVKDKLAPDDDLHWTGVAQRWNNMCAECHSTDYRKEFSPPADHLNFVSNRTEGSKANQTFGGNYQSSFMEIDVSCEACHGPGSVHVELAGQTFPGWNRDRGYGLADLKKTAENQIQACAPCHSRRNVVHGGFRAGENFYDYYSNALLTAGVYYPDGQILDEDYVHGSFIQSKMYHKGIRCTDCHDPHSARLKHDGNQVCTSCHQHPTAKYDSVGHHFHKEGSEGAKCVNCHMPATTYMEVDSRRDHSFRIPRPDLSTEQGTPNACTSCHLERENVGVEKREGLKLYQDWMQAAREGDEEVAAEIARANQWCDDACEKWYGEQRRRDEHFGIAISAGQKGEEGAVEKLEQLLGRRGYEAPAIARASALNLLSQIDPEAAASAAETAIKDDHPLVRQAALAALLGSPNPTKSVSLLERLLDDPIRSVRIEASRVLTELPIQLRQSVNASKLRSATEEWLSGLEYNNDRAGAHLAKGIMAEQQGRNQQALKHYQTALSVEPNVTGPRTNLAALLERNLSSTNQRSPAYAKLQSEIAELRRSELPLLQRDADLLPGAASIQYRLGLAYYIDDQKRLAAKHLSRASELEPEQHAYAQTAAMLFETLANDGQAELSVAKENEGSSREKVIALEKQIRSDWNEALAKIRSASELSSDQGTMTLLQRIEAAASNFR